MLIKHKVKTILSLMTLLVSQYCYAANLIPNSDFSQIDSKGNPVGWMCTCQMTPTTCDIKKDPISGTQVMTLPSGCVLSSDYIKLLDHDHGVRLDVTANEKPAQLQDFNLFVYSTITTQNKVLMDVQHPVKITAGKNNFSLQSDPATSENGGNTWITIVNNSHEVIHLKQVSALQDGANPAPKSATLLKGIHSSSIKLLPHYQVQQFWVPLPIDYASQVPLWLNLSVAPTNAIRSIHFKQDNIGNWGAIIALKPHVAAGTTLQFKWESIVLTKMVDDDERSQLYRDDDSDPSAWLQSTAIVQSQDQSIANTAQSITGSSPTLADKMAQISSWEHNHLHGIDDDQHNDAITSFTKQKANCTGFSNLAAAMGRAVAIPTRTMACIMTDGETQSTHYINEYYAGANAGWSRLEPQSASSIHVPEDGYLILRKNTPDDESDLAYHTTNWIVPGTPVKSMNETLDDPLNDDTDAPTGDPITFPDCPFAGCDNQAEHWVDLRGSHEEMKRLFIMARKNWQYDLHDYLTNGSISPKRQALRQQVSSIQSVDDFKRWLDKLDSEK